MIELKIEGNLPSKANRGRIFYSPKGTPFLRVDQKTKKIIDNAELQIKLQYRGKPIEEPVEVKVFFFFKTRRRRDIDNIMKTLGDVLEKAGVLKDDNLIFKQDLEKITGVEFDGIYIFIKKYKPSEIEEIIAKFKRK